MKAHFAVSGKDERHQADGFRDRFGVELERIPQGPGVCGDYLVIGTTEHTEELEHALGYSLLGRKIEFKNDKTSLKYKSFFVEFQQTSDSWVHKKQSGHELAIEKGCVLVISSGSRCFVFNKSAYVEFVKGITRVLCTKFRSNGNRPDSFAKGKIVPLVRAERTASFTYNMSSQSSLHTIPV